MIKLKPLFEWTKYSVSGQEVNSHDHEPWRGPHVGKELLLMLKGRKPLAIVSTETYGQFRPYVKNKLLISKPLKKGLYVVALPSEEKRMEKLIKVFHSSNGGPRNKKYHAMIGILLGYSKEDIKKFINDK